MLHVHTFSPLVVLQKTVGMVKTHRVAVVVLFSHTDIVGLKLRHVSMDGRSFARQGRVSDKQGSVLQVESLELCSSPVCSSDSPRVSSQICSGCWWRCFLAVASPVLRAFTPVLSCQAVTLRLEEYPMKIGNRTQMALITPSASAPSRSFPSEPADQPLPSSHYNSTSWI